MQYWLVKQEPEDFSWSAFMREGRTAWTGVRNFQARNNLRAMKKGDQTLYYHSGEEKRIVGIARVERDAYPDPTATEGDWSCVDLLPLQPLSEPITLKIIKADAVLKTMALVRNTRLSVVPVTKDQFQKVVKLSQTKLQT
jgi:predicted RNA-binding protein with PUA-like domain